MFQPVFGLHDIMVMMLLALVVLVSVRLPRWASGFLARPAKQTACELQSSRLELQANDLPSCCILKSALHRKIEVSNKPKLL